MIKRILTGVTLIACLVGFFFLREISNLFFDALIFIVMIGSMYELTSAFSKIDIKCNRVALLIYTVLFGAGFYLFSGINGVFYALILASIIALVCFTFSTKSTINDLLSTLFVMIYPALFLYFALKINHFENGLLLIVLIIAVSVLTDTFAYFVGSAIKGKKLCPKISPKKTISGAIGGVIGGIIASLLVYLCFEHLNLLPGTLGFDKNILIIVYLAIGIIGAVFDEVGDLVSSQIKRKTGIKDFGNIFPGHGGIMDRIDGLCFVLVGVALFIELFSAVI